MEQVRLIILNQTWLDGDGYEFALPAPDEFELFARIAAEAGTRIDVDGQTVDALEYHGEVFWPHGRSIRRRSPGFYDKIADRYDAIFTRPEDEDENRAVLKLLDSIARPIARTVLDIGSGTGLLLDLLALCGWKPDGEQREYLGVDPSRAMTRKLEARHPGAKVLGTTLEEYLSLGLYRGHRYDLVAGLFASMSYVDPAVWPKILQLVNSPGGHYLLMFYADPKATYERYGFEFPHYHVELTQLALQFGTPYRLTTFWIATNISGAAEILSA